MKFEDVPDELIDLAEAAWPEANQAISCGDGMARLLAAVLPAHEAMVRAKAAEEIEAYASCLPNQLGHRVRWVRAAAEIARGGQA